MRRNYQKNVFINCPFDKEYYSLLRPMIFTLIYLGFTPRIALERFDSGEARIHKIIEIIKECKFGIHDLSRLKSKTQGEFYRLNMPFELGLDMGAKIFCNKFKDKRYLILEKEPFRYQAALSDLSNSDIKTHKNDARTLIRKLRNWFSENGVQNIESATAIWYKFNDFMSDFYESRKKQNFSDEDIYEIPIPEYVNSIKKWLIAQSD